MRADTPRKMRAAVVPIPRRRMLASTSLLLLLAARYVVIDEAGLQFDLVADEQLTLVTASFPVRARSGARAAAAAPLPRMGIGARGMHAAHELSRPLCRG